MQAEDAYVVDIDPYSNRVMRIVDKNHTPYAWAHRIHGSLLLGDAGDVILEVVAGLAFLLIVTGPYMWLRQRSDLEYHRHTGTRYRLRSPLPYQSAAEYRRRLHHQQYIDGR